MAHRRTAVLLALTAAAAALDLKPNASSLAAKYANVRDALQAKLPDPGAKLADALTAPFANKTAGSLYNDVVTSGGLKKCYDVGFQKLLTMGQVVNGEVSEKR